MDTRGQGSAWRQGDTPTPADGSSAHIQFHDDGRPRSKDILLPARFCRWCASVGGGRSHPAVDAGRIAVTGSSQGGGIALAISGWSLLFSNHADVPSFVITARNRDR